MTESQRGVVRKQHWLLFPILLFARISWCLQSITFPLTRALGFRQRAAEALAIAAHYAWLFGAAFATLPPVKARTRPRLGSAMCKI